MSNDYRFKPATKDPGESFQVTLNLFRMCANYWRANEQYQTNEFIRPNKPTGFSYQAQGAGTSGGREPNWPKTLSATVADGSLTWITTAAAANGVNPITSPSATADTGLTVGSVVASESTKILATYSSGNDGQDYDAVFTFTLNGVARVARQTVKVRKR